MKKSHSLAFMLLTVITIANSQKKKDQKAIKSMCGCYEVSFNFVETFQYSKDTKYVPSKVKHDHALEWVELVDDTKNKIVMQHLLIADVGKAKPMIIKHWRQDWEYENRNLYTYEGDRKWTYHLLPKKEVKGQWTQKVFQVDDSPRYEGTATWIHEDGKTYWLNTTNAPLPRREYTKRHDYNITVRTNKHEITKTGWIHEQDNDKVIRKESKKDFLLAEEKGVNVYTKIEDSKCKAAQDWWKEHKDTWELVRAEWEEIYNRNKKIELLSKVEGKRLYEYLFDDDFKATPKKVNKTIMSFVK